MSKTLTVKKGELTGAIPVYKDPAFGGATMIRCPVHFGVFKGEKTERIGTGGCTGGSGYGECRFFKGLITKKDGLYILCRKARIVRVKNEEKVEDLKSDLSEEPVINIDKENIAAKLDREERGD